MEVEKINITIPENFDQSKPIEIVLREGSANDIKEKQALKLDKVAIRSIADYIEKRNIATPVTEVPGLIIFSFEPNPYLKYMENPNDEEATILVAPLELHPDFLAWGINEEKQFNQKQLEKHIRKLAHCFADPMFAKTLILNLQNFEVKYEQTVIKEDNRQGQKKDLQTEAIQFAKGELPREFLLSTPVYKNTSPVTFHLEIEVDKGPNNMPLFSFYSMDTEILKKNLAEDLIKRELDRISSLFPVIRM